jgi:hypothetical protein
VFLLQGFAIPEALPALLSVNAATGFTSLSEKQSVRLGRPIESACVDGSHGNTELLDRCADLTSRVTPFVARLTLGFHIVKIERIEVLLALIRGAMAEY